MTGSCTEDRDSEATPTGHVEPSDVALVEIWLRTVVHLPQYYRAFVEHGYDSMSVIREIDDVSKLEEIGIHEARHQRQIMETLKIMPSMLVMTESQVIDAIDSAVTPFPDTVDYDDCFANMPQHNPMMLDVIFSEGPGEEKEQAGVNSGERQSKCFSECNDCVGGTKITPYG